MPTFQRKNGISIYYEVKGSVEKTAETIVLIGGLTRDHTIWRKLLPSLEKKFRIILADNRDAGQSSTANSEYNISDLAEDISDLIINLSFGPVHIVGHSMGGFMGFHIAAKHPELVKTLILCSTAEKQTKPGIEYLTGRIKLIDNNPSDKATPSSRVDIVAVMDKIYATETLENKEFVEEIIDFETTNPHPQTANAFRRQATACLNHNAEDLLKDIHCPTLIVTGEHDKTFPPNVVYNLAEKLNSARITIIPSAAHMIQLEKPAFLYDKLNNFVSEHSHKKAPNLTIRSQCES